MRQQIGEHRRFRGLVATLLVAALTMAACDQAPAAPSGSSSSSGGQPSLPGSPTQPAGPLVATGIVSGDGQPLENATVEVRTHDFMEVVTTDASGRYQAAIRGASPVWVTAYHGHFVFQPCAVWFEYADSDSPTSADVRLSSAEGLSSATLVSAAGRRHVSGTIYEMTSAGKQPVPNAVVAWDVSADNIRAWTETDTAGRFTLCGLPAGTVQIVSYNGRLWAWSFVEAGGDAEIELILKNLE